jgi:hypothetical protein
MKKTLVLIVSITAMAIAVLTISAGPGASESKQKTVSITGTWQLASYKYGSALSGFTDVPPGQKRIKLITDTHFTWINYDTNTNRITSSAGGTYTLVGDTYTESIDFGMGMDSYLGNKPAYKVTVEGDMFFLSGELTESYKIEEIWQRVK